ncbi:MAG: hypothetical protein QXX35_05005 [Desulfurococcaceae archaeon]|uniref:Uncharacterized protein n=1 Tax=Staphylothermus marinus TaxID=2280 RepID=A0A7C4H936_STAMA
MSSKQYICKRDGKPMYLIEETEKLSTGEYRITFTYRCLVCGYSISNEQLIIKKNETGDIVLNRRIRRER